MAALKQCTLHVADLMSNLMYAYRYKLKDQYFKTLDKLKEQMDANLYQFYFNFGCGASW